MLLSTMEALALGHSSEGVWACTKLRRGLSMTDYQRGLAQEVLRHVRTVLRDITTVSRKEWTHSDVAQWRIRQAIVALGIGSRASLHVCCRSRNPWWWRAQRLSYGLRAGSRLNPSFLWESIRRDWPNL